MVSLKPPILHVSWGDPFNVASRKDSITEAVSGIAHEINQPLAAISAYLHGCLNHIKKLPKDYIPNDVLLPIIKAEEQAQRAGNIIHSLKNLLSNNDNMINGKLINLNKIILKAQKLEKSTIESMGIKIVLTLDDKVPSIKCDEIQIIQLIHNLIQNAVDAICINDNHNKKIIITSKKHSESIIISIEDSGCGIEKTNLQNVFLPFFTTKKNGSGIGLSLCYQIMQRHKGTITVKSGIGKASTFYLQFPLPNDTDERLNLK